MVVVTPGASVSARGDDGKFARAVVVLSFRSRRFCRCGNNGVTAALGRCAFGLVVVHLAPREVETFPMAAACIPAGRRPFFGSAARTMVGTSIATAVTGAWVSSPSHTVEGKTTWELISNSDPSNSTVLPGP